MNIAQGCAAEPDRRRDVPQAAVHEHHVRRVHRDVRARPDGDADIRAGQGRRVIDTVAHHGDLAVFLERADHALLAVRQHARDHGIDARLPSDGVGGALIVAG